MSEIPLDRKILLLREAILDWALTNTRDFPWRKTTDPYKICAAEIMLHQTGAHKVVPIYQKFIDRYPTLSKLSLAKIHTLRRLIYPLGFIYRAERLKELASYVIRFFGGQMPSELSDLTLLPGVGEYTASAIMCFAYGKNIPIIDTNVVRVYTRYFRLSRKLPSSSPNAELKEIAGKVLPAGQARAYNYAVLDFAATLCKHYNPICSNCPLASMCEYCLVNTTLVSNV